MSGQVQLDVNLDFECSCSVCQSKSGEPVRKVSRSTWFKHRKRRDEESGAILDSVPEPGLHFIEFLGQHTVRASNIQPTPLSPLRRQPQQPCAATGEVAHTSNMSQPSDLLLDLAEHRTMDLMALDNGLEVGMEARDMLELHEPEDLDVADDVVPDPACLDDLADHHNTPLLDRNNNINLLPNHLNDDDPPIEVMATLEELKTCQQFISMIQEATLDNSQLELSVIEALRNPQTSERINLAENPGLRTGIELFLDTTTASEDVYNKVRTTCQRAIDRAQPGLDPIPSLYRVKEAIRMLTGIYPLVHDMCLNTCTAYTGPFSHLEQCPICTTPRFTLDGQKQVPQRQFQTIPLGPQLQALWANPEGAKAMRHRYTETNKILEQIQSGEPMAEWSDVYHGSQYLEAVIDGRIKDDDTVLMLSLDGAQLYASKQSDCWVYIWVVLDLPPDIRYKKRYVFPGGFIPGPNKPKNVDSFMFPGLHHLSGLAKEGLIIWDSLTERLFRSDPFLHLVTADGPGLTCLNGLAGHSGAYGCRLYCTVKGRRRANGTHYYPALLKPHDYSVHGCDHDDIKPDHLPGGDAQEYERNLAKVIASRNITQQNINRRETGITKPSLISALPKRSAQPIPLCCGVDLMHMVSLNLTELLLGLWRGTLDCDSSHDSQAQWPWVVLIGDTWKEHGKRVAEITPYLPGSFDRPPRNPAEKINSGYKAWEFLTYVYGLCPALLYGVLPTIYWTNFCKLVAALRILHQRKLTKNQLIKAHRLIVEFVTEFEELYYQRLEYRLHFCRQSIHALLHLAPEITRLGPGVYYTQWTMERTLGNLLEEIRQHSNPFQNLAERGVRRAQSNSLMSIIPDLAPKSPPPRVSIDLGTGYILLGAKEEFSHVIPMPEATAVHKFFNPNSQSFDERVKLSKWARVRLPNNQIIRSLWKEKKKGFRLIRIARNVMFYDDGTLVPHFGEVQYFFQATYHGEIGAFAMISEFSAPDAELATASNGALLVCRYQELRSLRVIKVVNIVSGIAMIPFNNPVEDNLFFVCDKMGSEVAFLGSDELELS